VVSDAPSHRPGFGYIGTGVPELIIGVRPIWRAHGVGRALLQRLCERARAEGFGRISLSVERGNFAQTLYRSEGFAVTQAGHGRDTMVKRLR
jgi:GNAT superfamily N-acetyltransferase